MYATEAPSNDSWAQATSGSPKKVSRGTSARAGSPADRAGRGKNRPAVTETAPARKCRRDAGIARIESSLRLADQASTSFAAPDVPWNPAQGTSGAAKDEIGRAHV